MEILPDLVRRVVIAMTLFKRKGPKKLNFLNAINLISVKEAFKGFKRDPLLFLGFLATILLVFTSANAPSVAQVSYSFLNNEAPIQTQEAFLIPTDKIKESPELTLIEKNTLTAISPPIAVTPQVLGALSSSSNYEENRREIVEYTVQNGDSLWGVAQQFGVSVDTVIWANNIESAIIQPGQNILILPVSGVMHQVKAGDTVSSLASKYKVNENDLLSFNDIKSEGDIFEDEILIIPGGQMPSYSSATVPDSSAISGLDTNNFYGKSHDFPYGQCTWWVAQKRVIPSWGNAIDWIPNAAASGYSTCVGRYCIPQAGAVISLQGNKIYGHVGYVEQVKGDKVIFSEMNYIGWGKMNYRTLRMGDPLIKGYIY